MEANELRIGNWVHQFTKIDASNSADFTKDVLVSMETLHIIKGNNSFFGYEPIPLTEEWLVRFGLIDIEGIINKSFPFGEYVKTSSFGGISINYQTNSIQIMPKIEIKHVHQLQNLYFALTGEELTIL